MSNTDLPRRALEDCVAVARPINDTYAATNVSWDEIAAASNKGPLSPTTKYPIWGAQAYGPFSAYGVPYSMVSEY